jgi:hypothetical protein
VKYFWGDVRAPGDIASCVGDMKVVIDRRFERWMDALASWTNDSNALIDTTVIGAGLAGGLAGGLTSQIMNAVSSGLTGTKKTVDQDIFLEKSVSIIVIQMKTDRAKWDSIIETKLQATTTNAITGSIPRIPTTAPSSSSTSTTTSGGVTKTVTTSTASPTGPARGYSSLGEAWGDIENYSRQGSFNNALTSLTADISAQAAACQAEKVNVRQANTGSTIMQKSAPAAATATSPCPTSSQ